jgi:sugar phosphate isomerase/epimerase
MVSFPQEDYSTLDTIRTTGGILPDEAWQHNRGLALDAIKATAAMKVPYLSTHAGFIDHTDAEAYSVFCDRMRELANAAQAEGIMLLMETGQETAEELRDFLQELNHPAVGVNFDPANMILYAKGDPIEAVRILAPWIQHVHFKDAVATKVPGEWGQEVPWGDGEVGVANFLQALQEIGYKGAGAIEREAGDQREEDILYAATQLNST